MGWDRTESCRPGPLPGPAPASPIPLPSRPLGAWPQPQHSQGLEAAEASEHAPVHRLQLVPRQHQLLHAGGPVKGALSHLLDLIIAQVSRRRDRGSGWMVITTGDLWGLGALEGEGARSQVPGVQSSVVPGKGTAFVKQVAWHRRSFFRTVTFSTSGGTGRFNTVNLKLIFSFNHTVSHAVIFICFET